MCIFRSIINWIRGWFRDPYELTDMYKLEVAVDEVNKAWARIPRKNSLWIDWETREVTITESKPTRRYP